MGDRIKLEMNPREIVTALAEKNVGAMSVCVNILKKGPDGLMVLLRLDAARIYGSQIWLMYSDVCDHDMVKMETVLLALQWGIVSDQQIRHAMENRGEGIEWQAITEAVAKGMPQ